MRRLLVLPVVFALVAMACTGGSSTDQQARTEPTNSAVPKRCKPSPTAVCPDKFTRLALGDPIDKAKLRYAPVYAGAPMMGYSYPNYTKGFFEAQAIAFGESKVNVILALFGKIPGARFGMTPQEAKRALRNEEHTAYHGTPAMRTERAGVVIYHLFLQDCGRGVLGDSILSEKKPQPPALLGGVIIAKKGHEGLLQRYIEHACRH